MMPVLEEMPIEEKVRRANVLLKTRPRDVEETLLQLINDDDQVIAASAIDTAREHKIWALADDIEHVLAHRDVRDWYVFEAASWALAEQRMPAERRRELWNEPLPAAELAPRLRDLPLFASVTIDELFRIASAAKQVRHDPGTVLLTEGAIPETLHFLLDGRVIATGRESAPQAVQAPAALGFTEALSGMPMASTIRTDGLAVTLAMSRSELRTLLADNTDLVTGLFATLSSTPPGGERHDPDNGRGGRPRVSWRPRTHARREGPGAAARAAVRAGLGRRDALPCRRGKGRIHAEGDDALHDVGSGRALADAVGSVVLKDGAGTPPSPLAAARSSARWRSCPGRSLDFEAEVPKTGRRCGWIATISTRCSASARNCSARFSRGCSASTRRGCQRSGAGGDPMRVSGGFRQRFP